MEMSRRDPTSAIIEWDFFIAYQKTVNSDFAKQLYDALSPRHRVFLDEKVLDPGDQWPEKIMSAIRATRVTLIVLSGGGEVSGFLREEISRALDLLQKDHTRRRVVPIFPSGVPNEDGFPAGLFRLQAIDGLKHAVPDIVARLRSTLAATPDNRPERQLETVEPLPPAGSTQFGSSAPAPEVLDFALRGPFDQFDKEWFRATIATTFGVQRSRVDVRAIARGSVIVSLGGDTESLASIAAALEAVPSSDRTKRLVREANLLNVRARTPGGVWRALDIPQLADRGDGTPPPRNAGDLLRLDLDAASAILLRTALDSVLTEGEVVSRTLDAFPTIPGVEGISLWLVCRPQASLCQFYDGLPNPILLDGAGARDIAESAIRERKWKVFSKGEASQHFIPIIDHGTLVGAAQIAFSVQRSGDALSDDRRLLLSTLVSQVGAAIRRVRSLRAQRDISRTTTQALIVDRLFDLLLDEIAGLGFDYAAISIADHFRGDIGILRAKNLPAAWASAATHPLDHWDVVPDTYRSRKSTGVIEGWDERLDPVLYEQFDHAELARVFTPIMYEGSCLGVVEYGCSRTKRRLLFTPANINAVDEIIRRRAQPEFALARPYVLLEKIAEHAMDAFGVDAAVIYVHNVQRNSDDPYGEPVLAAGAGMADSAFVKRFAPRRGGIGYRALLANRTLAASKTDLERQNPDLYALGVRAIAAAPMLVDLQRGDDNGRVGLLYLGFRDVEHTFTSSELQAITLLARQAEVAIANALLIDQVKEDYRRAPRYSRLLEILRALPNSNLTQVLTQIVKNILRLLGAHNVVLYEYFQDRDVFSKPITTGHFLDEEAMHVPMPSDGVARWVLEKGKSRFVQDMHRQPDLLEPKDGRTRFAIRENIHSSAALVLKDGAEVLGILFVNYRTRTTFSSTDQTELQTLASTAGMAISSSRQRKLEEERPRKELEALRAVEAAISQADLQNINSVLQLILDKSMELVAGATLGVIMLLNAGDAELTTIAARGFPKGFRHPRRQSINQGVVGVAARSKKSQRIRDVAEVAYYHKVFAETRSELAVPILDGDRVVGVVNLESTRHAAFTELHQAQLESLSRQVVLVMRCIQQFQEPIPTRRLLQLVQDRLHSGLGRATSVRVVLTAITAGQALGFSRAMVFGMEADRFNPLVAVGALTRAEAELVWERLDEERAQWEASSRVAGESTSSLTERLFAFLMDSVVEPSEAASNLMEPTPLEAFLARLRLSLAGGESHAMVRCVRTKEAQVVSGDEIDGLKNQLRDAAGETVSSHTLFLPVCHGGEAIGVLVVDSEFLPEGQQPPIRARLRTGNEKAMLEILATFTELLAKVLV